MEKSGTDHDSTSFKLEKSKKNEECCSEVFPSGFWTESKKLLSLTWPIVIDIFREIPVGTECILIHFQTLTQVLLMLGPVSLVFCAHLGSQEQLDGAALAISVRRELNISHDRMFQFDLPVYVVFQVINSTCITVAQGLGTACDTFFSQSVGSSNKKKIGVYMQRGIRLLDDEVEYN